MEDMDVNKRCPGQALLVIFLFILACCGPSAKISLEPDSLSFYENARLIMSNEEKDIFNHLPDTESRREFIEDFWAKRDPNPGTEENEFRDEFFRRVEYANERFREGMPGWKTDRGRIYIYFGDPDKIDEHPFVDQSVDRGYKGYIVWVYYRYALAIEFLDKRGDGSYTIDTDPYTGGIYGSLFEAMERAKFGLPIGEEKAQRFMNFSLDYDSQKKDMTISIPTKSLTFVEEEKLLKADFEFTFFLYRKGQGEKQSFSETRHLEITEEEVLKLKKVDFTFSVADVAPGKYYFDVVIVGKPDIGKTRKIFSVKI